MSKLAFIQTPLLGVLARLVPVLRVSVATTAQDYLGRYPSGRRHGESGASERTRARKSRMAASLAAKGTGTTDEDVALARTIIGPDEIIIAVWTATPDEAQAIVCQSVATILLLPCTLRHPFLAAFACELIHAGSVSDAHCASVAGFWPHFLILSPCCIVGFFEQKAMLEHTMVVLTNKKVHRKVDYVGMWCGADPRATHARAISAAHPL